MRCDGIGTNAEDVQTFEMIEFNPELVGFDGSPRGVVFWIEEEHRLLAVQFFQGMRFAELILEREVRER